MPFSSAPNARHAINKATTTTTAAAANPIEETRRKAVEDLGSDHACATRGALNLLIAVVLLTITPETPGRSLERIEADAEARHS